MGGDEFCCERQADNIPTLILIDKEIGRTLIPHVLALSKRVTDRTIEVALINQQMVVGSRWLAFSESCLYQVSINGYGR